MDQQELEVATNFRSIDHVTFHLKQRSSINFSISATIPSSSMSVENASLRDTMPRTDIMQLFSLRTRPLNVCAPMVRYSKLPFRELVRRWDRCCERWYHVWDPTTAVLFKK